jgi:hypothetical protein
MDERRSAIDPEDKYPSEGFRSVERNALRLIALWPCDWEVERARDVIQLSFGGQMGLVVIVTSEAFEFRVPSVEWTMGPYGPAASSRPWKRIACDRVSDHHLRSLIETALAERSSEFKTCKYCGRDFPPEYRHADDVCHCCAERYLGIVH